MLKLSNLLAAALLSLGLAATADAQQLPLEKTDIRYQGWAGQVTWLELAEELGYLAPLKAKPPGGLIVDLGRVNYFGSVFISFLLRCHLLVKKQGSELILTGVSEKARELLRVMSLDTLWAIYESRDEALAALGGSD